MVVPYTCKNEEDPIKNEGARVPTGLDVVFFPRRSRGGGVTPKSVVEFCRNSNFGPIRSGTAELAALEHLKRVPLTYNGKIWLAH